MSHKEALYQLLVSPIGTVESQTIPRKVVKGTKENVGVVEALNIKSPTVQFHLENGVGSNSE